MTFTFFPFNAASWAKPRQKDQHRQQDNRTS